MVIGIRGADKSIEIFRYKKNKKSARGKERVTNEERQCLFLAPGGVEGHNGRRSGAPLGEESDITGLNIRIFFSKMKTLRLRKGSHRPLRQMKSPIAGVI